MLIGKEIISVCTVCISHTDWLTDLHPSTHWTICMQFPDWPSPRLTVHSRLKPLAIVPLAKIQPVKCPRQQVSPNCLVLQLHRNLAFWTASVLYSQNTVTRNSFERNHFLLEKLAFHFLDWSTYSISKRSQIVNIFYTSPNTQVKNRIINRALFYF